MYNIFTTQRNVEDATRYRHELPAFVANVCTTAARSNFVVVGHVNVEDQFSLDRLDWGDSAMVFGPEFD